MKRYRPSGIEHYTSAIPSGTYLSLAIASIGLSLALQVAGRKNEAQFVGQWVPTILILGLGNKDGQARSDGRRRPSARSDVGPVCPVHTAGPTWVTAD